MTNTDSPTPTTSPLDVGELERLLGDTLARFELLARQDRAITGVDIHTIREGDGGTDLAKRVVNLKGAAQWAVEHGNRIALLVPALIQRSRQAERMEEALKDCLAAVDKADRECPINNGRVSSFTEQCPKCGASSAQNCGPNVMALSQLDGVVRSALLHEGEEA